MTLIALIDATSGGTTEFNGAMILSGAMYKIAMTALANVGHFAQQNVLLKDLFLVAYFTVVINLVYEATKLAMHGVWGGFMTLLRPDYIRKVLRALIFTGLGLGAYGVLVVNGGVEGENVYPIQWYPSSFYEVSGRPFEFFRVDPDYDRAVQAGIDADQAASQIQDVKDLEEAVANSNNSGIDFGDEWIAVLTRSNVTPEVMLAAINTRITDAVGKMGAWHFVTEIQSESTVSLANVAAEKVWKDLGGAGAPPSDGGGTTDPNNPKQQEEGTWAILKRMIGVLGKSLITAVAAVAYTAAYFCMDLVICKVLWMNAIYLAISYKVGLLVLPIALVLGYFPATSSVLNGVAKHIIICVISFKLYGMAITTLINPTYIRDTVVESMKVTQSDIKDDDTIYLFAKSVYIEEIKANGGKALNREQFVAQVRAKMQSGAFASGQTGVTRRNLLPLVGLMMLAFLVSLVGKVMTIMQDSINGQMTYHRG